MKTFEFDVKMEKCNNVWLSVWLYPETIGEHGQLCEGGEFDVLEQAPGQSPNAWTNFASCSGKQIKNGGSPPGPIDCACCGSAKAWPGVNTDHTDVIHVKFRKEGTALIGEYIIYGKISKYYRRSAHGSRFDSLPELVCTFEQTSGDPSQSCS